MIKFESSSDRALRHALITALQAERALDDTAVSVKVEEGVVTLNGSVPRYDQRSRIQEIAHRVPMIHDVVNEIDVGASCYERTDFKLARSVRSALERVAPNAAPQIQATVAHRWVLLEGAVATTEERRRIVEAVQEIAGVCGVDYALETSNAPPVQAVRDGT